MVVLTSLNRGQVVVLILNLVSIHQLQPYPLLTCQCLSLNRIIRIGHQALSPRVVSLVDVLIQFAKSVVRTTKMTLWLIEVVVLDVASHVTN